MGMFDKDPSYRALKRLRDSGYKGPVDQDGKARPEDAHLFEGWGGRKKK